jgi:hypothetical protein
MLKTRIKTVLVIVTLLFGALSMFAQTSQTPAAQGAGAQSNSISNVAGQFFRLPCLSLP